MIGTKKIVDTYRRLAKALGTRRVVLIGGCAVKLAAGPSRKVNDVDVAVIMPYGEFLEHRKRLESANFELKVGNVISLYDRTNMIDVDLGKKKEFGPMGKSFGMTNSEIGSTALVKPVKLGGEVFGCAVMGPEQMLRMKVWLLLNRKHDTRKQAADRRDIISILKKFY
ncbi:MAG: hypothetical protein KGH59_03685 [Candidatus Micrarchaeota archaeon]|nr:hypothetical protein [Candidatus Micrarchaeota archaeon]MDE1804857.1 hypothetical protein [Candidatus Micrarchaeota archaeon]MDE1847119.1 hypothetical protein [Candidatus Micrarchaeota archaeon]